MWITTISWGFPVKDTPIWPQTVGSIVGSFCRQLCRLAGSGEPQHSCQAAGLGSGIRGLGGAFKGKPPFCPGFF